MGSDAAEGDAISFTVNGTNYSGTVDASNNFSIDVAGADLAAERRFDVTVAGTDDAGNSLSQTETSTWKPRKPFHLPKSRGSREIEKSGALQK